MKKAASILSLLLSACIVAAAQGARRALSADAGSSGHASAAKVHAGRPPKASALKGDTAARDDEVERLLVKHILAQGGVKLFTIRSRVMRGRVEMSLSNLPGTFESYEKAPDKAMSVLNAPSGQFIQAYDGGKRWLQSPWGGMVTSERGALEVVKQSFDKGGFKWRNIFSSASIRGRAVVDGHETVVLAATPVGRGPLLMYFDADTYLLRKQEFVRSGPPRENELRAVYIDSYAEVDGVKVPVVFRQVYPDFTLTFRIFEVKHNVPIEDALFQNP